MDAGTMWLLFDQSSSASHSTAPTSLIGAASDGEALHDPRAALDLAAAPLLDVVGAHAPAVCLGSRGGPARLARRPP